MPANPQLSRHLDLIHIESLELSAQIGVPEEERALHQRLTVNLTLKPVIDFRALGDRVENTVNYFEVALFVQAIAREKPRKLIETLGENIAMKVLASFPLEWIEIELRKYILPSTAYVAVRLRREK